MEIGDTRCHSGVTHGKVVVVVGPHCETFEIFVIPEMWLMREWRLLPGAFTHAV